MRNTLIITSVLFACSFSACKKDEAPPADPAREPVAAEPVKEEPAAVQPEVPEPIDHPDVAMAMATIKAASGSKVEGVVHFSRKGDTVSVHAKISGLEPGEHGFHVHEIGDCSAPDAKSAGGHFNPAGTDHGDPKGEVHHAGDLGNIIANAEGVAELSVDLPTSYLNINADGSNIINGRAVVVHGGTDDLKSQPSGAAGPRVGCGVIKGQAIK